MKLIISVILQLLWSSFVTCQISSSCLSAFRSSGLTAANSVRPNHSSQLLNLDTSLQTSAQAYADKLAADKKLVYSGSTSVGENIFDKKVTKALTNDFCASKILIIFLIFYDKKIIITFL